jgi:hypothetical protein
MQLRFVTSESAFDYFRTTRAYLEAHGKPVALEALGERESGTALLDEAVTAYRAALEERTRERVPLQPNIVARPGEAIFFYAFTNWGLADVLESPIGA